MPPPPYFTVFLIFLFLLLYSSFRYIIFPLPFIFMLSYLYNAFISSSSTLFKRFVHLSSTDFLSLSQGIGNSTVPRTGGHPPVFRRSDPQLRYQFHEPVRRSVDDHIRYRKSFQDQMVYKQQLGEVITSAGLSSFSLFLFFHENNSSFHSFTRTCHHTFGKNLKQYKHNLQNKINDKNNKREKHDQKKCTISPNTTHSYENPQGYTNNNYIIICKIYKNKLNLGNQSKNKVSLFLTIDFGSPFIIFFAQLSVNMYCKYVAEIVTILSARCQHLQNTKCVNNAHSSRTPFLRLIFSYQF